MLKRNLKPMFFFLLTSAAIIIAAWLTYNDCAVLAYYRRHTDFGFALKKLAAKSVLLIIAIILWRLSRSRHSSRRHAQVKSVIAILLPCALLYGTLLAIPTHLAQHHIVASICDKSSDKTMPSTKNMTQEEYSFIRRDLSVLPELPRTATHIDMRFYGDDFLGDYWLFVHFSCDTTELIPANDHWHTDSTRGCIKYIGYENGAQ